MKRRVASLGVSAAAAVAAFAALAIGANEAGAQTAPSPPAPTGAPAGKAVFESVCSNCHELSIATDQRKTRADWGETVDRMIGHGAPLSSDQAAQVVDYLTKTYGPDSK